MNGRPEFEGGLLHRPGLVTDPVRGAFNLRSAFHAVGVNSAETPVLQPPPAVPCDHALRITDPVGFVAPALLLRPVPFVGLRVSA